MPKLAFPKRHTYTDGRSREYLTAAEVERLRKVARSIRRHGLRNDTMILLACRHGLRRKMIAPAGAVAELGFPVHPHQLRHGCGFKLANDKQDTRAIQLFLGHRNIQHTVQYTERAAGRLQDFWQD